MAQTFDGIASDVEQLSERLLNLERRVSALESYQQKPSPAVPEPTGTALQGSGSPATSEKLPLVGMPTGAVPILGKAVLAFAGAYLLRAIAESGAIPKLPMLMVAIGYAGLWMVWAVRTHAASRFAGVTYGITAALILSPLLWESTVRFQVLSPAFTAVVLAAFVVLTLVLSWQRTLQVIPSVAILAAVSTALALIVATRALVPLTSALLAVALAAEVAGCLGYELSLRAVPAMAADFSVWVLVAVMTSPEGVPAGYRPTAPSNLIGLCFALAVIYGSSIGIRSFGLRHRITIFEIVQGMLALVLAAFGVMRASKGSAALALGAFFLLLAAVCYWGALSRFADQAYDRNCRVCATWAAALLLAGNVLLFPTSLQIPFLCLAAVAATFIYTRTKRLSLGINTSFYLATAATVSSLPTFVGSALAGNVPAAPDRGVWIVAISAVLCYTVGTCGAEDHGRRLLWVVPSALVGVATAALAVVAIVWLAEVRLELTASLLSVIRTIVICSLALALGFLGAAWRRAELSWVAYGAVAFGTLKLVFEDFRFGNATSLVGSLLFYGLILILLPRLTRRKLTKS
jgi:hypothetical protein